MLHKPTAFVIGAGASQGFGFPVGSELANSIAANFDINFEWDRLTRGSGRVYDGIKRAIPGISNQAVFDLCHQIFPAIVPLYAFPGSLPDGNQCFTVSQQPDDAASQRIGIPRLNEEPGSLMLDERRVLGDLVLLYPEALGDDTLHSLERVVASQPCSSLVSLRLRTAPPGVPGQPMFASIIPVLA